MKAKTILGPPGWPLVGQLPAFLADKLGFLMRCAEEYGGIVRLDFGGTTYLVNEPEDIRHVLETTVFAAQSYATGLEPATKRTRSDRNRTPCLPYE